MPIPRAVSMAAWLLALVCLCNCSSAPSPIEGDAVGDTVGSIVGNSGWSPQRAEFDAIAAALAGGDNEYLGRATAPALRTRLQASDLSKRDRLFLLIRLTQELLEVGEVEDALATVEQGFTLTQNPQVMLGLLELRAIAFLRQAEVQNCIENHKPGCCIFPLSDEGVHARRIPAMRARDDYLRMLQLDPANGLARWLLNITYMALGEYPDNVPEEYLLPPTAFASQYDIGRFPDIAPRLGVDTFNQCGGAIVEDFDNDGLLDILTSSFDPETPMTYYRNTGSGSFEDRSDASRVSDQLGGLNIVAADYDNDGHRDFLALRGAWLHEDGRIRNSLLRNTGNGTFVDVTRQAGLAEPAYPTQAAVWGDFNNDGHLDLYVGNESAVTFGRPREDFPSQLFRNNGDGTFTDIAREAGVTNDLFAKAVATGDYDNDGDLDLYVSNVGANRLFRNDGGFRFTDVAAATGTLGPDLRSFVPWFFDYDNDGWLDLFVAGYQTTIDDIVAEALGMPNKGQKPCLYHNDGDGTFTDVTAQLELDRNYLPMGANFGDLDNDGWLDFYLGTGNPDYRYLMPNVMLRNDRGQRFQDVTQSGGFGHLQKGHGIAFADIDNDGDQDIYHQLGGFFPGDKFHNALFQNPGHGNNFITLKLVGSRTNRDAFGARIKVVLATTEGRREIHRAIGSVSSFGGSPSREEIGLGRPIAIERVEVFWPASGTRTVLTGVAMNSRIRIVEGEDGGQPLTLARVDL